MHEIDGMACIKDQGNKTASILSMSYEMLEALLSEKLSMAILSSPSMSQTISKVFFSPISEQYIHSDRWKVICTRLSNSV